MSNERIDLTYFQGITEKRGAMNYEVDENGMVGNILGIEMNQKDAAAIYNIPKFLAELKRCYEVMNEVILRAMNAREEEVSDIIKHGDEEYVHVNEITYPFSKSDIDAALDSKASE